MPRPPVIIQTRLRTCAADAGLSAHELARRVGVSQPTITRLMTGEQSGSKHIVKIARALGTTPEYLLGETDDPDGDDGHTMLSVEARELLDRYLSMSDGDRRALLHIVRSMSSGADSTAATLHNKQHAYRGRG